MMREMPGLPYVSMPVVDVRDVAEAHFRGLKVPDAAGQRFILCSNSIWFTDIGKWLHAKYSPDYNVPTN
jgi:dihydroflavonol-4-reductase